MKKVLFITNIPAPYRVDFFNALGKTCDLTVLFEARRAPGIRFNWNEHSIKNFRAIFLSDGEIRERRVDVSIFGHLKRGRYDHIVATSYGYFTEMAALFHLLARRIPYELELDGGVVRAGEGAIRRLIKRTLIRGARRIFSSSACTDAALLYYGAAAGRIVRYPFTSLTAADILPSPPSEADRRAFRARLGVPEARMVLAVGQFIPRKGFDVLLRCAKELPPDVGVYLAGAEPADDYRAMAEGLNHVHFVGFLTKDELNAYFRAADVLALPTREDMWGLVVNEALSNALPVITTDRCVAGLELVRDGENGYLIAPDDADALLASIRSVVFAEPDARRAMAEAALFAVRPYTIERMVDVHLSAFASDGE